MTPIEAENQERNDSRNLEYVANKIAKLKGIDVEEMNDILINNANNIE